MAKLLDHSSPSFRLAVVLLIATFMASNLLVSVSARYLPTRSMDGDRLEKLRELLKDLLESDNMERRPAGLDYGDMISQQARPPIYKRSVTAHFSSGSKLGQNAVEFTEKAKPNFRKYASE